MSKKKDNMLADKNGRATDLAGFVAGVIIATIAWVIVVNFIPKEFVNYLVFD